MNEGNTKYWIHSILQFDDYEKDVYSTPTPFSILPSVKSLLLEPIVITTHVLLS